MSLTFVTLAQSVVLDLLLQGSGPMDDLEVLTAANERAIAEDGCDIRSKLVQKTVCLMLFNLGYEFRECGRGHEFYISHPAHEQAFP